MKMWCCFTVTPFLSDCGFCLNWICCENVTPLQNTPGNCTTAELGVVWSLHISSVLFIICFSLGLVLCFNQAICSSSYIKHVVWKKCDTDFLRRDMPFDFWFCPAASGSSRMWQWLCGRWRRVWLWVNIGKCIVLKISNEILQELPVTALNVKWTKTGNAKVLEQRIHNFSPFSNMISTFIFYHHINFKE